MKKIALMLSAIALFASLSAQAQEQQRPPQRRGRMEYGVRTLDQIRWRDNCVLADPVSKEYIMVGPAGRSVMSYKSKDLINWEGPTIIYTTPEDHWGDIHINSIWAPELHYYNGKYYLFQTYDTSEKMDEQWRNWYHTGRVMRGSQIVVADSPYGPYKSFAPHSTMPSDMMTMDGTLWVEDGVPYMVYCHEWVQVTDGAVGYVRLKPDLSDLDGEPKNLFRASYVNHTWGKPIDPDGSGYVTDGPYLLKGKTGKLYMIWTTNNSCGIAISDSGKIAGPWRQQDEALITNAGHGMIFKTFEGELVLCLHTPYWGDTHPKLFLLEDTGETLRIVKEYGK